MVSQLFAQMAEDVASDYQAQLGGLNMEQRLNLVTDLLRQEGFTVQWEKGNDEYIIREIGCPYYHVGQNHPEVCSVDQTLISRMLSVPAEKVQCLLNGDATLYLYHSQSAILGEITMEQETKNKVIWQADSTHPNLAPQLRDTLREVVDPEIGLSIIELGLIRDVVIDKDSARIDMILTTPFCPYGPALLDMTRQKAEKALNLPTTIELGMEMWDFSMMEEGAGADWGLY